MLAFPILYEPALQMDKIFGYSPYAATILAMTCGYFAWDVLLCLRFHHLHGPWFLLHAISCFTVYFLSFHPIFQYYGGVFLMYELSTPFLNVHWFCDKLGLTGSRLQIVNGLILVCVFFSARIVYGYYQSALFFMNIAARFSEIPLYLIAVYTSANILLNILNAFWLYKMIVSVSRRLNSNASVVDDDRGGKVKKM